MDIKIIMKCWNWYILFKILIISILLSNSLEESAQYNKSAITTTSLLSNSVENNITNNNSSLTSYQKLLLKIAAELQNTKHLKVKKEVKINDKIKIDQDNTLQVSGSILFNKKTNELTFIDKFLDNINFTENKVLIARGRYTKTLHQIGWSKLFIETFNNCASEIQSFAAGYIEGKLTAKNILEFYKNLTGIHADEEAELKDVFKYYGKVEKSIRHKSSKEVLSKLTNELDLEYWITVAMVQAQTDGLYSGYNNELGTISPLSFEQFYFINADGEVPELMTLMKTKREMDNQNISNLKSDQVGIDTSFSFKEFKEDQSNEINYKKKNLQKNMYNKKNDKSDKGKSNIKENEKKIEKFSKEYLLKYFGESDATLLWSKLMSKSHCSALIKAMFNNNGEISEVFVGHTTWDSYSEMHRIFKVYDFNFDLFGKQKHSKIIFSSYPGTLTSTDDFYLLNSKISVLETTLEILDRELYLTSSSHAEDHVPNYIRISTANRIAETGKQWTDIFKRNNSGTYNSQWMILDFQVLDDLKFLSSGATVNGLIINNSKFTQNKYSNNNSNFNKIDSISANRLDSISDEKQEDFLSYFNQLNLNNQKVQLPLSYHTISTNKSNTKNSLFDEPSSYYKFKEKMKLNIKNESKLSKDKNSTLNKIGSKTITGFFHVLEQIPGYIQVEDMTNYLIKTSFWASYNRPFLQQIYVKSGYQEMMKKYGLVYSYYDNPRAQIFASKVMKIKDIEDVKILMQSSKGLNDSVSINSISPRFDLSTDGKLKRASGGIDTKITSYSLIKQDRVVTISGPAYKDNGKPFNWNQFLGDPHYGLPSYWNFKWNEMTFNNIKNGSINLLE